MQKHTLSMVSVALLGLSTTTSVAFSNNGYITNPERAKYFREAIEQECAKGGCGEHEQKSIEYLQAVEDGEKPSVPDMPSDSNPPPSSSDSTPDSPTKQAETPSLSASSSSSTDSGEASGTKLVKGTREYSWANLPEGATAEGSFTGDLIMKDGKPIGYIRDGFAILNDKIDYTSDKDGNGFVDFREQFTEMGHNAKGEYVSFGHYDSETGRFMLNEDRIKQLASEGKLNGMQATAQSKGALFYEDGEKDGYLIVPNNTSIMPKESQKILSKFLNVDENNTLLGQKVEVEEEKSKKKDFQQKSPNKQSSDQNNKDKEINKDAEDKLLKNGWKS